MAILEKEVVINLTNKTIGHYIEKGYDIPKVKDKSGRMTTPVGTHMLVKVEDLQPSARVVRVTKVCDICREHVPNQPYYKISKQRNNSKDGLDRCKKCAATGVGTQKGIADINSCVATTHPEFAEMFWNVEDTFIFSNLSNKKADFKCLDCGRKVEKRVVSNIFKRGISCPYCSDGLSYPEKFTMNFLEQMGIHFLTQYKFKEVKNKKYDFFIPSLNCIIETHGGQHYEKTSRGRSLAEEQENDKLKKLLAIENGISNYIVIDCRFSEIEWIKNNILNSKLSDLLDLSNVDWLKCHEYALNSLIKKACDLWNEGIETASISKLLKLNKVTIRRYLKNGSEVGWCDYSVITKNKN